MDDMLEIKRGDKHVVRLWDIQTANLIIEAPTGVIYTNQCGGNMCSHPELEGFLVPMRWFDEDTAYKLLGDFWFMPGHDWEKTIKKKAAKVNVVVSEILTTLINTHMQLDESRIYTVEWGEAWIPVTSDYGPGILTWENSD